MMLERSFSLNDGGRVRLRFARARDFRPLARLLRSRGIGDELEAARLVRFDPRRQAVVCASRLEDGSEHLVAAGAIDLSAEEPALVVTAPGHGAELRELVATALVRRAAAHSAIHDA